MNNLSNEDDVKTEVKLFVYNEIIDSNNIKSVSDHYENGEASSERGDPYPDIATKVEFAADIKNEVAIDNDYNPYQDCNGQQPEELTCNHCGFLTFKINSLKNHMKSEHITEWDLHSRRPTVILKGVRKVYPCSLCQYRPSSRVILKHHLRNAHKTKYLNKPPLVECKETGLKTIYTSVSFVANSVPTHLNLNVGKKLVVSLDQLSVDSNVGRSDGAQQNGNKLTISNPKFVKIGKDFVCLKCSYKSIDRSIVDAHIRLAHQRRYKTYICDLCSFCSISKLTLANHINNIHKNPKVHVCDECNFRGRNQYEVIRHKKCVHNWKELVCYHCGYEAIKKINMKKHIVRNHLSSFCKDRESLSPLECSKCDFTGKNQQDLDKHILVKHKKKKDFFCDKCTYTSAYKWCLEQHKLRVHEKAERFWCDACDFVTFYKAALKVHKEQIHNNVNSKCMDCEKIFKSALDLKKHIMKYHEKCYLCKICNLFFSSHSDLNRHNLSVHEKRKDFVCHMCNYKSSGKFLITQHIKYVHLKIKKKKHLQCQYCKKYRTHNSFDLKKHIKLVHKKMDTH